MGTQQFPLQKSWLPLSSSVPVSLTGALLREPLLPDSARRPAVQLPVRRPVGLHLPRIWVALSLRFLWKTMGERPQVHAIQIGEQPRGRRRCVQFARCIARLTSPEVQDRQGRQWDWLAAFEFVPPLKAVIAVSTSICTETTRAVEGRQCCARPSLHRNQGASRRGDRQRPPKRLAGVLGQVRTVWVEVGVCRAVPLFAAMCRKAPLDARNRAS
jgi:hypothetical protein